MSPTKSNSSSSFSFRAFKCTFANVLSKRSVSKIPRCLIWYFILAILTSLLSSPGSLPGTLDGKDSSECSARFSNWCLLDSDSPSKRGSKGKGNGSDSMEGAASFAGGAWRRLSLVVVYPGSLVVASASLFPEEEVILVEVKNRRDWRMLPLEAMVGAPFLSNGAAARWNMVWWVVMMMF